MICNTTTNRKCLTTILLFFDFNKISIKTLKERITNDLKRYIESKSLIKSFCSEIEKQLKSYEIPPPKRKKNTKKQLIPLYKYKSEFHMTKVSSETLQNGNRDLEYLFFENLVREIKSCRIVNKKSVMNLFNFSKLELGNKFRIHQYRYGFSNIEFGLSRAIRHRNLTVWSPNSQSVMLSIESKQDKGLCNLELLNKGFEQIAESFNIYDIAKLTKLFREKEANIELGIKVLTPIEIVKQYFELYPKTYEIYGIKFWFDYSDGLELDISLNCKLENLITIFKFIKEFIQFVKLYEKEILTIEPFSLENLENNSLRVYCRNLSLEPKRCYEKRDFYTNKKSFVLSANWIFSRLT